MVDNAQDRSDKFDVILVNPGENRLQVIRFIRELSTPMKGLAEAKDIIDSAPQVIIKSIGKSDGEVVISKLAEIGCTAKIVLSSDLQNDAAQIDSSRIKSTYLFAKDQPIKCPRCGSMSVTTTSRGYSLVWGFVGSNKTVNRCGKCGYTWKP